MRNIFIIFGILLFMGCASTKPVVEVPIKDKEIIEYRDTTIYLEKIVEVPVPVERVVEVVPKLDTLFMETSVAKSKAWVDTTSNVLRGKMENKKTDLKGKIDTCFVVEYVNQYLEKPIIQEVEVPVKYIPKWVWVCIFFTFGYGVWLVAKIWFRFR